MMRCVLVVALLGVLTVCTADLLPKQTVALKHRLLTDNGLLAKLGNPGLQRCTRAVGMWKGRGDAPAFKSSKPLFSAARRLMSEAFRALSNSLTRA